MNKCIENYFGIGSDNIMIHMVGCTLYPLYILFNYVIYIIKKIEFISRNVNSLCNYIHSIDISVDNYFIQKIIDINKEISKNIMKQIKNNPKILQKVLDLIGKNDINAEFIVALMPNQVNDNYPYRIDPMILTMNNNIPTKINKSRHNNEIIDILDVNIKFIKYIEDNLDKDIDQEKIDMIKTEINKTKSKISKFLIKYETPETFNKNSEIPSINEYNNKQNKTNKTNNTNKHPVIDLIKKTRS